MNEYPITKLHTSYRDNHYYLSNTLFLDSFYAAYFTKDLDTPVWLLPTGPSGMGKSFLLKPFFRIISKDQVPQTNEQTKQKIEAYQKYGVVVVDQLTAMSFGSGKPGTTDLGSSIQQLKNQGKGALIYAPDMASIYYGSQDQTNLFAMFKTLFDGYTIRHTGSDNKIYFHKNVNFFGSSTTSTEYDWINVLGTRDIKFHLDLIEEMKHPRSEVHSEHINNVTEETRLFVEYNLNRLDEIHNITNITRIIPLLVKHTIPFRTETKFEKETGYFIEPLSPEKPMRLIKQFETLYRGFEFIGLSHTQIIEHLINLTNTIGNKTRITIYNTLNAITQNDYKAGVDITTIQKHTKLALTVILYNLNILEHFNLITNRSGIYNIVAEEEIKLPSGEYDESAQPPNQYSPQPPDMPEPDYPF